MLIAPGASRIVPSSGLVISVNASAADVSACASSSRSLDAVGGGGGEGGAGSDLVALGVRFANTLGAFSKAFGTTEDCSSLHQKTPAKTATTTSAHLDFDFVCGTRRSSVVALGDPDVSTTLGGGGGGGSLGGFGGRGGGRGHGSRRFIPASRGTVVSSRAYVSTAATRRLGGRAFITCRVRPPTTGR